jgi:hypothetical protein
LQAVSRVAARDPHAALEADIMSGDVNLVDVYV